MLPLTMILARARGGVIGLRGDLPWRIPEDLRRFKAATMGHTCIVGRVTYATLPHLPGRRLVVLSRTGGRCAWPLAHSIDDAISLARETDPEPIVIGGAQVYAAALPHVTRAIVTEIDRDVEGDTFFTLDRTGFAEVSREVIGDVDYAEFHRVDNDAGMGKVGA